jgi:hypothetical protein
MWIGQGKPTVAGRFRCYAGLLNQAVPNDNNKKVVKQKIIKEEHYGNNNPAARNFILSD